MKTTLSLILACCINMLSAQTTIVLQPDAAEGKDAKIFNLDAGSNFGSDIDFLAATLSYAGEPGTTRSLIEFDISSIPNNAGIVDARLSLYYNDVSSTTGHTGNNAAYLRRVTEDWDENTVRWADQPFYSTNNQVYIPASSSSHQDYEGINVAPLIRDILNNPAHSHGFIFMGVDELPISSLKFFSSDGPIPSKRPKLEITYITQPVDCVTLQPGSGGKDAKVFSQDGEGNFGNDPDIIAAAWTFNGSDGVMRSYMAFDLNVLPDNANVLSASLSLFYNNNSSSPGQEGANESVLQRVTEPWGESTISWGDQPATTNVNEVILPASMNINQDYTNINVTNLVQDMINDPGAGNGIMLKLMTEENFRALKFASSDFADPNRRPKLEVCYTIGTATKEIIYQPLTVVPNPFQNTITLKGLEGAFQISIIDFNGKSILNQRVQDIHGQIQCSLNDSLPPGVYIVKASGVNGNYLTRLVKL